LPGAGNGSYTLYAKAMDSAGHEVLLGSKTVSVDNSGATKPFGAIDTPSQGGTARGNNFTIAGWTLTPMPNKIPEDGSTISVYLDGINIGNPQYNIPREDVASLFPGYANSNGAAAVFPFDTTAYTNGLHTLYWVVTDNAGNADGIGSRYFSIENVASDFFSSHFSKKTDSRAGAPIPIRNLEILPADNCLIDVIKGYGSEMIRCASNERIDMKELGRIELQLPGDWFHIEGYMLNGDRLQRLPVGSSLDIKNRKFYWQPGPGFLGEYRLVFAGRAPEGIILRIPVTIRIGQINKNN
ncbi:MAG: hypothetical protein GY757_00275, partial [bacterium]|nr:hypothetical protein [bacterium]